MGEVQNEKKQLENKGTGTDSAGSLLAVRLVRLTKKYR